MSTVLEPETAVSPGERRFLLNGVSWETYRVMVEDPGLSGVRMTYDRGALELMSPSRRHEKFRHLLGRLIEAAAEGFDIPIDGGGTTTLRRELFARGLEPDECYYIANESLVRGRDELDLEIDPPPDLAVEVELTTSLVSKIDIYAELCVPELWRFDGKQLSAHVLGADGKYTQQSSSAAFPELPLQALVEWIDRRGELSETALIREFRQWVRDTLTGERGA